MKRLTETQRKTELSKMTYEQKVMTHDRSVEIMSKLDKKDEAGERRGLALTKECIAAVTDMPLPSLLKFEGLHCLRSDTVRAGKRGRIDDYDQCMEAIDAAIADISN